MEGRTYRYFKGDPLFPFGYGLSYSLFHYYNVWHSNLIEVGQKLEIRVEVGNTGPYDGEEVTFILSQNSHLCLFKLLECIFRIRICL